MRDELQRLIPQLEALAPRVSRLFTATDDVGGFGLPDGVPELVNEITGIEEVSDLCILAATILATGTAGVAGPEYYDKLRAKYADLLRVSE